MRAHSRKLILLTLAIGVLSGSFAEAQVVTALTGATLIDGNGGEPIRDAVVVVTDKNITAAGARATVTIPRGAHRIDVSGKYIVPGIMDGNVHLVPWPSWTYIEFLARYENNFDGIVEEAAQIALKHGLTTVFDSMGPFAPIMRVRDRINRGELEGTRIFAAGDIVGFRAVFTTPESMKSATPAFQARINAQFELNGGPDLATKSPDQVYEEMKRYVAHGVDFVKFGATGDGKPVNSEVGQSNVLRFTPEQMRAMVRAVHEAGKIIQTHQTSAESMRVVVEAGVDMAQHCASTGDSRMYEATIQLMLERKFYCGTQWGLLTREEENEVKTNHFRYTEADNGRPGVNFSVENAVRMIKAGVPQFVSTDAGTIDPDVLKDPNGGWGGLGGHASLIGEAEFKDMHAELQRGMTPMMVIQSFSKNTAAAYHKLDHLGTIEPGKSADLLVVNGDPLADIDNLKKLAIVMKEGKVIDTAALPRHPLLTSEEAKNPGPVRMK